MVVRRAALRPNCSCKAKAGLRERHIGVFDRLASRGANRGGCTSVTPAPHFMNVAFPRIRPVDHRLAINRSGVMLKVEVLTVLQDVSQSVRQPQAVWFP